jgi:uncharacterized membrane protein
MHWSLDILRQSGWDLWILVCAVGAVVLLFYAFLTKPWQRRAGLLAMLLMLIAAGGTAAVILLPSLHSPLIGLIWTFLALSLASAALYLNLELSNKKITTLLTLRILALALLVPMLFEPILRRMINPKPERPLIFIIDTSGSMSFPDIQNGPSRLQSVWQTLRPQLSRINERFIAHYFTFSTDSQELNKPDELASHPADGKSTDIAKSITHALGQNPNLKTDPAVILISDGIDNTSPNVIDAVGATSIPINTIRVGSELAEPTTMANIAIDNIDAGDDFVVDHESKVKVTVKSTALANRVVEVKLAETDAAGKAVGTPTIKTLVLQTTPEGQLIDLPYKPRKSGLQKLAIWIDPITGERSTVDNRQEFQGLALDPRIKLLYIEGRVRPEYTQLNRALSRDPNIEVASLLRITQDRFTAAGAINGEKIEQIPATNDQWSKIDVLILGDLDASFLTPFQQAAIEQFVETGHGLLMIGGQNSFGPGSYQNTPIEKALPVFVGDQNMPQERTPFVPKITPEGEAHPAMEGLAEWFGGTTSPRAPTTSPATSPSSPLAPVLRGEGQGEGPLDVGRSKLDVERSTTQPAAKSLPALRGNVVVQKPKAGASILLIHPTRPSPTGEPQIILATQRYGQGRSAAFTADTTYLWYLPLRGLGQDSPYNKFWGQLTRWLAGEDVRNRQRGPGLDGLLNKNLYQLGENVRVRAMVRDQRGDATQYAQVNLTLKPATGTAQPKQFPLSPVGSRTGLYDVTIPNPDQGDWLIDISATKDGKPLGAQQLKFTVIPPAEELLKIAANPKLLSEIAQQTKGFSYDLAQLPNLIEQLIRSDPRQQQPHQESIPLANTIRTLLAFSGAQPNWLPKYDLPLQATLITLLLTTEWLLRRRWQLP